MQIVCIFFPYYIHIHYIYNTDASFFSEAKKVPQPDTSTPIRNVSITSNNVQSNNNLSNAVPLNNNTLSQPPNFKKTILSSSPPNNSTQPEGVQSALNKQQSSTDIDTVGSSRPKKSMYFRY